MTRELTLHPWNAATSTYFAPVTKSLEEWGIESTITGNFRSLSPDEATLNFPGNAIAVSAFTPRSRIQLTLGNRVYFSGYVPNDPVNDYGGNRNQQTLPVVGPWWYLENLVYMLTVQLVTSYDGNNQPVTTAQECTHFTLNQGIVTTTPNGGISYTPVVLRSQDQLAAILDYAIANGAWLQYTKSELVNIPVLPRDVLNITCADAIRRQVEDVDAVCWFDHSVNPPKFNCRQRKDLPNIARSLGDDYEAQGFKLRQRSDLAVPSVRIDFEQTNSVNGESLLSVVSEVYPTPQPADRFKALIVTVPIRGSSVNQTKQWIKTAPIDLSSLDFWKARKPELDPLQNSNAAVEYANLQLVPGSTQRTSALTNMIVEGGYAEWMGGQSEEDNVMVQASYERQANTKLMGDVVKQHTLRARIQTTNLNYPNGYLATNQTVTQFGESPGDYAGMAQVIYEDLAAPTWEGGIPVFTDAIADALFMGINLNLDNARTEYATMNALVQEIAFTSKPGGLFQLATVGPNKKISPQQLADRLRAKRLAYITVTTFFTSPSAPVTLAKAVGTENISNAEPQRSQAHTTDGKGGVLSQVSSAGVPQLVIQTYDQNTGQPKQPADGAGRILLEQARTEGSDGKWHDVQIREEKVYTLVNGVCKQRTKLILCSDTYQASDDPA